MTKYEILLKELNVLLTRSDLTSISLDYDNRENTTWITCRSVLLADYRKYEMDRKGVVGDHVPEDLEVFLCEVHWNDVQKRLGHLLTE